MDRIFRKNTDDSDHKGNGNQSRKGSLSSNTEDESHSTRATSSGSEIGDIVSVLKKSTTDTALTRHLKGGRNMSSHNIGARPLSPPVGHDRMFEVKRRSSTPEVKETPVLEKGYDNLGLKRVNQYTMIREIGKGVHGKVKLCRNTETGVHYAMKIVKKNVRKRFGSKEPNPMEKVKVEIAILKKCDHPNVVKLFEVIDGPDSDKIYLVLEYLEGGSIPWSKGNEPVLSLESARSYFRDIVAGLQYLHFQGIVHRDIKPANLLIGSDGRVKISDFGVSQNCESEDGEVDVSMAKTAGTPAFLAPELCATTATSRKIGKQIDIWSLGVTLYCFVCGSFPFNMSSEFELYQSILNDNIPLDHPNVTDDLADLLLRMLEKDPDNRIDLETIKRHPWVLEGLKDPDEWIDSTDPTKLDAIHITLEDVTQAVTLMQKLKYRLRRFSTSVGSFIKDKRRGSSDSSSDVLRSSSSPIPINQRKDSLSGQSGEGSYGNRSITNSPVGEDIPTFHRRCSSSTQGNHIPVIKSSVSQELIAINSDSGE